MLSTLSVKNFAIIDNINVDFRMGMTVLTGETGAGKSLIIDSIGLLLGSRASLEMIRSGCDKAIIEGVFDDVNQDVYELLNNSGIEIENGDSVIIKREINTNSKSVCRVNGEIVTLAFLSDLGELLGDIHSSDDNIGLFSPKNYLSFLKTSVIEESLASYKLAYKEYNTALSYYNDLVKKASNAKEKEDYYLYAIKEFEVAKLSVSDEEDLNSEANILKNAEKIAGLVEKVEEAYNSDALDKIKSALTSLEKLGQVNSQYIDLKNRLEEAYLNIDSVFDDTLKLAKKGSISLDREEYVLSRLSMYASLKRKYNKSTSELIEYYESLKKELDVIENYDFYLEKALKDKDLKYNIALEKAKALSNLRKKCASSLVSEVINNLESLQLKNTVFEVPFKETELSSSGIDEIDFIVSFNKGEEARSLSKIASGGELSRFMLALKTALTQSMKKMVRIFDEVDHGVSGEVARSIGKNLYSISKSSQVLCITHLPQVASCADQHFMICKEVKDERTYSNVLDLNKEQRIEEIAKMMSDGKISEAILKSAQELLNNK